MNNTNYNQKFNLTTQVVMDVLENLSPIERIIVAAYYCDRFDIYSISKMFKLSPSTASRELNIATNHIQNECEIYQKDNKCSLCKIDTCIIYAAFKLLFKTINYILAPNMSQALYYSTCSALGFDICE